MSRPTINYAERREINNDLASGLLDIARDGGWFCTCCQQVTRLDVDREQSRCVICGAVTVKALEPVSDADWIADQQRRQVRAKAKEQPTDRRVPVNEAHARFEAIRALL